MSVTPNSNMGKTPFGYEFLLNFNDFENQEIVNDMEALAMIFQRIILFRKGDFPNQPELGVGIEDYVFELMEPATINKIENEIKYQCERFAPTNYTYTVKVEQMQVKGNGKKSAIAVFFYISKYNEENSNEPSFAILFNKSRKESKMLSKIYI